MQAEVEHKHYGPAIEVVLLEYLYGRETPFSCGLS